MSNPWLAHVKQTMKKNRGVAFKQVLRIAKKTYKSATKTTYKGKHRSTKKNTRHGRHGRHGRQHGGNVTNGANVIAATATEVQV